MSIKKRIALVVDSSGSIRERGLTERIRMGVNEHLEVARRDAGQGYDTRVWITTFADVPVSRASGTDPRSLKNLDEVSYQPAGSTALQDAIGFTIDQMKKDTHDESDVSYLVVILTDGEENCSVNYQGKIGLDRLKAKVQECNATLRWSFVFIGTEGLDAFATNLAIPAGNVLMYQPTAQGTDRMFRSAVYCMSSSIAQMNVGGQMNAVNYFADAGKVNDLTGGTAPIASTSAAPGTLWQLTTPSAAANP